MVGQFDKNNLELKLYFTNEEFDEMLRNPGRAPIKDKKTIDVEIGSR